MTPSVSPQGSSGGYDSNETQDSPGSMLSVPVSGVESDGDNKEFRADGDVVTMKTSGKAKKNPWNTKVKTSSKETMLVVFTFINCCIGSGLMAVPKIFSTIGFIVSIIYMVASTAYSLWCFEVINRADYHGNFQSIAEVSRKMWGTKFGKLVDICMVINGIGSIVAYVSISADYVREGIMYFAKIEALGTLYWKNVMKIIVSGVIIFPLSMLRSIELISLISSFAIIFAIVTVVGVNVRFFQWIATGKLSGVDHPAPKTPWTPMPSRWMSCITYFTTFFALYTIHANITPMQYEIDGSPSFRKKTVQRGTLISIIVCLVIYTIIGVEGAILFDRTCTDAQKAAGCMPMNSNILLAFGDDTAMLIIKLLYAIVILVSTPAMLYPVRLSICKWFNIDKYNGMTHEPNKAESKEYKKAFKQKSKDEQMLEKQALKEKRKNSKISVRYGFLWYILIGLGIITLDVILSVAIPEIDKILSIKSNIFGLVLYEMFGLFIFYRMNLCEKYSVGALLDEHFTNTKLYLSKQDHSVEIYSRKPSESFMDGSCEPKKKVTIASKFRRFSQIGMKNLGAAYNDTRKRSIIVPNQEDNDLFGLDLNQLQAELENYKNNQVDGGEVTWSNSESYSQNVISMNSTGDVASRSSNKSHSGSEHVNVMRKRRRPEQDAENIPTLLDIPDARSSDEIVISDNSNTDNASGSNNTSHKDGTTSESKDQQVVKGYHKMSVMEYRSNKNSEIIANAPIEIIFPDIYELTQKKAAWKKGLFIAINVFFCAFNLTGLAFDIYGWIVPPS